MKLCENIAKGEKNLKNRLNKYETNIKPRLKEIEAWLLEGVQRQEIYKRLEIGHATLPPYREKYPELDKIFLEDDIRKGRKKTAKTNVFSDQPGEIVKAKNIRKTECVDEKPIEKPVVKEEPKDNNIIEALKKLAFGYIADIEEISDETIFSQAGKELKKRVREVKRKMPVHPNLDALKLISDEGLVEIVKNYDSETQKIKIVDQLDIEPILEKVRAEFEERLGIKNQIIQELRDGVKDIQESLKKKDIAIKELKSKSFQFEEKFNEILKELEDRKDIDDFVNDYKDEMGWKDDI